MARKPHVTYDEDAPELTDEELSSARPAREVLPPDVYAALVAAEPKRRPGQRGPGKKPALVPITVRVSAETRDAFRTIGDGWQAHVRHALETAARQIRKGAKPS